MFQVIGYVTNAHAAMLLRILCFISLATLSAVPAELPASERIAARDYPSVFQAWNGAKPLPGQSEADMLARHDLAFVHPSQLGLRSEEPFEGTAFKFTAASVAAAREHRTKLLAKNPHMVLLAEVRYRDAPKGFIPENAPWWKRDGAGAFIMGWAEGGYRLLDVAQEDWQSQVVHRAKAVMDTGVFDGVMLDWWNDDASRVSLIRRVREAIGGDALILVNANDREIPQTAEYVNGLFMECYRSATPEDWSRISDTLRWAETHLRSPRINCVETWFHQSRNDFVLMRSVTTLALTQSDGCCLFSDPNDLPTADHLHDWYAFWDKGLGLPLKPGVKRVDGAWERGFTNGVVIYNPPGGVPVNVQLASPQRSRATGRVGTEFTIPSGDGDIFIRK